LRGVGTGISLQSSDSSVVDSVIFCTKLGLLVTAGNSIIENVHIFSTGHHTYSTAVDDPVRMVWWPFGGAYIRSHDTRLTGVYFDDCILTIDNPSNVVVRDGLWMLGANTVTGGLIVRAIASPSQTPHLEGLVVKGNYLTGAPSFKTSSEKYAGEAFVLVDSGKATGEFNFTESSAVDVSDTIFSEKIGPSVVKDGYRVQSTIVRQSLELRDATRWVFDCSRSLLFPAHGIDWISATVATRGVQVAPGVSHTVLVNGSVVVVETSRAVSALVSIEARQGHTLAGTAGIVQTKSDDELLDTIVFGDVGSETEHQLFSNGSNASACARAGAFTFAAATGSQRWKQSLAHKSDDTLAFPPSTVDTSQQQSISVSDVVRLKMDDGSRAPDSLKHQPRWRDSTEGVHSFLVFDYHLASNVTHIEAIAPQYDYVWGAGIETVRHWRKGNPDIIVAQYMMWNLAGPHLRNLTWLQANHPEWILYKCDRKTVQTWDHIKVQIDTSQASVVSWQLGMMAGEHSQLIKAGYNAISIDNYMIANTGKGACGHYARNGSWVQKYSGEMWDPAWRRDQLGWLKSFYAGLQATPAAFRPLLILNTDLSYNCEGSCAWDDETMLFIGNHSDGALNEGAWGWDKHGHLHLPGEEDAELWVNDLKWAENLQRAGKAYNADVESINATASPQSVETEFDAISDEYWTWWLACYLLAKGNASALYVTPVFPLGPKGDQYTYGRAPWYHDRYHAASAIGHAVDWMNWTSNVSAVRQFSNGFVAANCHALGTSPMVVALPEGKHYKDLSTGVLVSGTVSVPARNATVLILTTRPSDRHKTDDGAGVRAVQFLEVPPELPLPRADNNPPIFPALANTVVDTDRHSGGSLIWLLTPPMTPKMQAMWTLGCWTVIIYPHNSTNTLKTLGQFDAGVANLKQFGFAIHFYSSVIHVGHDWTWQSGLVERTHPEWLLLDENNNTVTRFSGWPSRWEERMAVGK
jgi:hypothetical protein